MNDYEFDTKQFIKEIQSRQCLWNVHALDYNDKVSRQRAWQETAKIMYHDWAGLDNKERAVRVRDLQKKWKGLRDYYTREKKNREFAMKKGDGLRRKRKTPFLDLLSFLNMKKKPNQVHQTQQTSETEEGIDLGNSRILPTPVREQSIGASTQPSIQETTEAYQTYNTDDQERNFLLSILPDMKSMTPSQNFEFRFGVMTLIKNIKYNEHSANFYHNYPGPSTFTHQVQNYETNKNVEMDPYSNESVVSSPEDIKLIFEEPKSPSYSNSK